MDTFVLYFLNCFICISFNFEPPEGQFGHKDSSLISCVTVKELCTPCAENKPDDIIVTSSCLELGNDTFTV